MFALSIVSSSSFIYQFIGIVALVICVLSFQIKNNKYFLLLQLVSCSLFALQFFLGGSWAGFLLNCVCVFRCLAFAFVTKKRPRRILTVFICLGFAAAGIVSYFVYKQNIILVLIATLASIVGAISIAFDNEKIIRYVQIAFVSPCWIAHNIFFLSIGGIVSEALNIVSALIALLRWKKADSKVEMTNK